MLFDDSTIAAIATPEGSGGIGIIRISGSDAVKIADSVFTGKKNLTDSDSYKAVYGNIIDNCGEIVDEVICLVMHAPKTYTCENIVEINAHGGPFVLKKILNLVLKKGARLANPGEFTLRGFLNGRIDLTKAEAVVLIRKPMF